MRNKKNAQIITGKQRQLMQGADQLFHQGKLVEDLSVIKGISFSPREIDILACLMHMRGPYKISSLLAISPNTVVAHIRNIRLKIGCSSREGIIDFIEKSSKSHSLRIQYTCLIFEEEFKKALKSISSLKKDHKPPNLLIHYSDQNLKNLLLQNIKGHLKYAGMNADIIEHKINLSINSLKNHDHVLIILLEKDSLKTSLPDFSEIKSVDLTTQDSYYLSVISILHQLFIDLDLQSIFHDFLKCYEGFSDSSEKEYFSFYKKREGENVYTLKKPLKNKLLFLILGGTVTFISIIAICFFKQQEKSYIDQSNKNIGQHLIRSDLAVPAESFSLHRPEILAQVSEKLKGLGIQTVALIGPGGGGKTTLARQYARQESANVIWELDADSKENLKYSFESLARTLASEEEDQKIFRGIQETKDPIAKEEQLIQFVRERLKAHQNWLLIYDNLKDFAEIQKYFPQDPKIWGGGKIILTTRDANIQNNSYLNGFIPIRELSAKEQLTLFTKIMTNGGKTFLTLKQTEEAKAFLKELPFYPLDIAVAAYYLKSVNVPYAVYLNNLEQERKKVIIIQEKLLQEAGEYTQTRYSILTVSLQHLINTDKNFENLLVLISLLDSQNIPRSLLNIFKDKICVDNFIYNLKKYSLITSESSSSSLGQTISIHRDTQAITLDYLLSLMSAEKRLRVLQNISKALEKYTNDIIVSEDLSTLQFFVPHCEAFLNHGHLLKSSIKYAIRADLGSIYYFLGSYTIGKELLEDFITVFDQHKTQARLLKALIYLGKIYIETDELDNIKKIIAKIEEIYKRLPSQQDVLSAIALTTLGDMYDSLGNYQKAKELLSKSASLHKKKLKNHLDLALTLGLLGNVCRKMGNYRDAKNFLEESFMAYKNANAERHFRVGWVFIHLGNIYAALEESKKAHQLIEKGVKLYRQYSPEDHSDVAWATGYLGNSYIEIGDYERAKDILKKTLIIYQRNFEESHGGLLRTKTYLAKAYLKLKNYKGAKTLLNQVLKKYEESKDSDPVERATAIQMLAEIHFLENQLDFAENLMKKALKIFNQFKHPNVSRSLESLTELYLKKSELSMDQFNIKEAKTFKTQAVLFLNLALKSGKKYFPVESSYIKRIESKLRRLKQEAL